MSLATKTIQPYKKNIQIICSMRNLRFTGLGVAVSQDIMPLDNISAYQDLSPRAQSLSTQNILPSTPNVMVVGTDAIAPKYLTSLDVSPKVIAVTTPKSSAVLPAPNVTNPKTYGLMTLKTVVADKIGVLPLVTVTINDKKYATTEAGVFQKVDVNPEDIVTITYVGYAPFKAKAADVPPKVILVEQAEQLDPAVVEQKPKKKSYWGVLALLALTGYAVKEGLFSDKPNAKQKKPIKAKI